MEMTFSYNATLEEVTEPSIRQFELHKDTWKTRLKTACRGALFASAAVLLVFKDSPSFPMVYGLIGTVLVVGAIDYFAFLPLARARLRRYVKRHMGGTIPIPTTYRLDGERLNCTMRETIFSFSLKDLLSVTESDQWIDVNFGSAGLCVIPTRAFAHPDEQAQFVAQLKNPQ